MDRAFDALSCLLHGYGLANVVVGFLTSEGDRVIAGSGMILAAIWIEIVLARQGDIRRARESSERGR